MYAAQVLGDCAARRRQVEKACELRMVPVATGSAAQHGLREQRFPPQRDQAAGIEILRMQAPKTQVAYFGCRTPSVSS